MVPPFRAPRIRRTLGEASPLAIALSSAGAGLQGYARDKSARDEMARLNEAEKYRRQMDEMKLRREQEALATAKEEKRVTDERARQALRSTAPARLGRQFTESEAELIAGGQVNPSDLFPATPQSTVGSVNAETRRQTAIAEGLTAMRMMATGGGQYSPDETSSFWTSFNLATGGAESDMDADEKAITARNVFNQWKRTVDAARAQRNQPLERRRRVRIGTDTTATNAAGQPVMPGTPGIPMYSRQARPQTAQQDSASAARLQAMINTLPR
jgi:hypothetical protein